MSSVRNGYWMEVYSGIKFYPFDPHEDEINIIDIAHALSNICRFSGHTKSFYSVAQHCIHVSELCKDNKLEGLLHDSSEAYLSDVPRPVKLLLPQYKECELNLLEKIFRKYNLKFPIPKEVKIFDNVMLEREHRHVLNNYLDWGSNASNIDTNEDFKVIYNSNIVLMTPNEAEERFLELFKEYSNVDN